MADRIRKLSWALVAVLTLSLAAMAAPWFEDFDSYVTGSSLHGQGGWKGWDNDPTWTAPTSSAQSVSAPNSVQIGGNADLVHEYSVAGGFAQYSTMLYIPDGSTGVNYFIMLNEYNDGVAGVKDWSVQTLFDMAAGEVSSYYVAGSSLPIVWDQWVELRCVIDLDANTVTEYYNGNMLATHEWDDGASPSNTLAAVDLFANGGSPIFYDDMTLVIPEPCTLSLLALGGIGLLARRRKR